MSVLEFILKNLSVRYIGFEKRILDQDEYSVMSLLDIAWEYSIQFRVRPGYDRNEPLEDSHAFLIRLRDSREGGRGVGEVIKVVSNYLKIYEGPLKTFFSNYLDKIIELDKRNDGY